MNLTVSIAAEKLTARLLGFSDRLHVAMVRVMNRLSIEVQSEVKGNKLSGQVLHTRTGTLRRSINRVVKDDGDHVSATVGTNVKYARVHEYGFDGTESVRQHVRRSSSQMKLAKFRTKKDGTRVEVAGSYAKAGGTSGEVIVRAHARQVHVPERSFLRSTLREQAVHIRADIKSAALGALK